MSLPITTSKAQGQPSIRSFFAPKSPSYVSPPSPSATIDLTTPSQVTQQQQQQQPLQPPAPPQHPTIPTTRRPQSLHPQASIVPIEPGHISALRRITSLILPINYPDSFYTQLSNPATSGAFSRVILWTEPRSTPKVIGGLVCRPEDLPFQTPSGGHITGLYIQSLVLLSPYRSLGLAASCLEEVVSAVSASSSPSWNCETVWAHVWTRNDEGLDWYKKRGFGVAGEIKNYYFKLQPGDALVVQRPILVDRQPSAAAGMSYHKTNTTTPSIPPSTTTMAANLPLYSMPPMGAHMSAPPPPASNRAGRPTPPSTLLNGSAVPPPPQSAAAIQRPPPPPTNGEPAGTSFQNTRPETEWNDLPADMQVSLGPTATNGSRSGASSRSSSAVAASRKKRDRTYPAAAFGGK